MAEKDKFIEIGTSGLERFGGTVYEEFLQKLRGELWRKVLREMLDNDPIIGAVTRAIELLIRQARWDVVAANSDNEALREKEFFEQCLFKDMSSTFEDNLSEIISHLWWGWAYLEEVYKQRGGESLDPKRNSKFSDGRIGWRKWAIRAQETLSEWEFDDEGGIKGMWQWDVYADKGRVLIPIEKALHFRTTSRKNSPEAKSLLRNAYTSYYYKNHIIRIEAIGVERDLAGYPVFKIPGEIITEGGVRYAHWKKVAVNIRRDELEGLIMPSDLDSTGKPLYELTLLSTGGTRQFDTDKIINRHDSRMAMSVLADFIMLGHEKVGNFALSKSKTGLFTVSLKAILDSVADTVNRFAFDRLAKMNAIPAELVPRLAPGKVESVDLAELGKFISDLSGAGMPLFPSDDGTLEKALIEMAGLPAGESENAGRTDKKPQEDEE